MKFLKILLAILVILVVIIIAGSFFLPKTYSVSRSVSISAPDSVVYRNIADFKEFYKWNPWAKMEPSAKVSFSGTAAEPGHIYEWAGKETGAGQMKILKVETNKLVDIDLFFKEPFESHADTKFEILPEGPANKVTWTMSGENNMISKWMCLIMGGMDKMIGKDFETGLADLKKKSESTQ
ncbi:SRPBCC family protein [Pedobacter frigidisoli]|uniref:SRPBCC family protein n=1 Tax=Pedobacter frigidisoli TaxID=2530455 RepID=UPI00292D99FA|nr:SRPBCC family protein [Pedobacter frigidisoli]